MAMESAVRKDTIPVEMRGIPRSTLFDPTPWHGYGTVHSGENDEL